MTGSGQLRGLFTGVFCAVLYLLTILVPASLFSWLAKDWLDVDYFKVLSRLTLLLIALSWVILWPWLGLSRERLGLIDRQNNAWLLWIGWGLLMVLPLILFYLVTGFRVLDDRVVFVSLDFARTLLMIIAGACLVALFEEVLFRGLLYDLCRRVTSVPVAAFGVSLLYMLVHYLSVSEAVSADDVGPLTGLSVAMLAFGSVPELMNDMGSAVSLFVIGLLLIWAREQVNLYLCIALHATWVFAIRGFKAVTVRDVVNPYQAWAGTLDNFIGPLTLVWLGFILVVIVLFRAHRRRLC